MKHLIKKLPREGLLLTEKDNRKVIINKIGLDQEAADISHDISDKYSIWIANQAKVNYPEDPKRFLIEKRRDLEKIIKFFTTTNKPNININKLSFEEVLDSLLPSYKYITDWSEAPSTPSVNLKQYTWDEAIKMSDKWHESLEVGGEIKGIDDNVKVIHKFNDGYYWALTESNYCEKSKESMGHCAEAQDDGMYLLHLRKNNREHVTIDWHPTEKYVIQIRGKSNEKPNEKYHKYILWLLVDSNMVNDLRTSKSYDSIGNFSVGDFSEENFKYLLKNRPSLIDKVEMLNILKTSENPQILRQFGDEFDKFINNLTEDEINGIIDSEDMAYFIEVPDMKGNDKNNLVKLLLSYDSVISKMNTVLAYFFSRFKNPEEIVDTIFKNKDFRKKLYKDKGAIEMMLKYHPNPKKMYNLMINDKDFIKHSNDNDTLQFFKLINRKRI